MMAHLQFSIIVSVSVAFDLLSPGQCGFGQCFIVVAVVAYAVACARFGFHTLLLNGSGQAHA